MTTTAGTAPDPEQPGGDERPEHGAGVIHRPVKAESSATNGGIRHVGDQRVSG